MATKKPPSPRLAFLARKSVLIPLILVLLLVTSAFFYYQPLKIWYREVRQERVLRAQLIAIQEYNNHLRDEISSLETTEGMEDYARSQLDLIKKGDNAVIVLRDGEPLQAKKGSVEEEIQNLETTTKPFGTWTDFLDQLFAVR